MDLTRGPWVAYDGHGQAAAGRLAEHNATICPNHTGGLSVVFRVQRRLAATAAMGSDAKEGRFQAGSKLEALQVE